MITFQLETWAQYYNDPQRETLWWEHYRELEPAHRGQMEMSPDVAFYETMERAGCLMLLTARQAGRLVGYCIVVAKRHTHYSALCAFEDSYFLTKDARRGIAGVRLFSEMLRHLKARGCQRSYWMTKEFASIARVFEHLGMRKMDEVYVYNHSSKE